MIALRTPVAAAAALALVALTAAPARADVMQHTRECATLKGPAFAQRAVDICTSAMRSGLSSDKVRATNLVRRGDGYRHLGNLELAVTDYSEALAITGPRNAEAWYGRGLARSGMGQFDGAIADLTRAGELRADDATVFLGRGNAYAGKGDYAAAIADYNRALAIIPNMADARYARATANNRLRNQDAAFADYMEAIDVGGDSVALELQAYLKARGQYQGQLDGAFGADSQAALRACIVDPGC